MLSEIFLSVCASGTISDIISSVFVSGAAVFISVCGINSDDISVIFSEIFSGEVSLACIIVSDGASSAMISAVTDSVNIGTAAVISGIDVSVVT